MSRSLQRVRDRSLLNILSTIDAGVDIKKKINKGRFRPEVRPLSFLYTIFGRNDTPFVYLLMTNSTPFLYHPNRESFCHFHAAFNKLKRYSHRYVC